MGGSGLSGRPVNCRIRGAIRGPAGRLSCLACPCGRAATPTRSGGGCGCPPSDLLRGCCLSSERGRCEPAMDAVHARCLRTPPDAGLPPALRFRSGRQGGNAARPSRPTARPTRRGDRTRLTTGKPASPPEGSGSSYCSAAPQPTSPMSSRLRRHPTDLPGRRSQRRNQPPVLVSRHP
jgi:hypothetical protein